MNYNWITLIAGFLLLTPILLGLMRGLPGELEMMQYRIRSAIQSVQWIAAYALAFWGLRTFVKQNGWSIPQVQWVEQQLHASLTAWAIAIPIAAILLYWLIDLFMAPVLGLVFTVFQRLQGLAGRLPMGASRFMAALLQTPKALLRTFAFLLLVHVALPFLHAPSLSTMAEESSLYQWTNSQVIHPLFSGALSKQLPILQNQAANWFHQVSQEAAKNGPDAGKGFFTWQTRFDSNDQIDATARKVVQGATSDREKAYRLYQWIGSHITYDDHKAAMIEAGNYQSLSFGAVPTFESGRGVCSDYSALMVAMGRAVGLQVKQEFGNAVLPDGSGGPHAWNVVYLADEKKWIPCDPTWAHGGDFFDNKDFYTTHHPESH